MHCERVTRIANLMVVQRVAVSGVMITFWNYFRRPPSFITLRLRKLWLWL
jgi:hypothetical protein